MKTAFFSKKSLILAFSFFLPVVVMLTVYCLLRIYPFGERSVLWTDLNGQYISYLSYYRQSFMEHGSLFYTFSKNVGGDMVGLGAYYLASPLNLILLFFDTAHLSDAVFILQLLRIGLCGLTMNIFLNRNTVQDASFIFSSAYALMAYNIVYSPHIMWMDSVILLPVIALGIERIYKNGFPFIYSISLGLALVVNYYIGFMLCIFSVLYFCYLLFSENNSPLLSSIKKNARVIMQFTISSLLAGGMAAFVLLPVLHSLQGGKAKLSIDILTEAFKPNFPIFDLFSKLFTGSYNEEQMVSGLPNIYSSMLVLLFCIVFFLDKDISARKKIGLGLLLSTILASFYIGTFNLIWHGFNYPGWFLYRYSFVFSFLLISIASQGYKNKKIFLTPKMPACIFSIILILSLVVEKNNYSYLHWKKIYASISFFIIIVVIIYFISIKHMKIQVISLAAICLLDLGLNAFLSLNWVGFANYNNYAEFVNINEPIIEQIKESDSSFFRMEKTYQYSYNDAMLFKYNGLSHFSSSEKQFLKNFMGKMGFRNNRNWAYYNQGSTISVDSLFGVKYLLTKTPTVKPYELLSQHDDILVYQNPYALPLGFMANKNIEEVRLDNENLFALQNNIWSSMVDIQGEELFYPETVGNIDLTNLLTEDYANGIRYIKEDKSQDAFIEYHINITSKDPLYVYFPSKTMRQTEVFLNDESLGMYFDTYRWDIINLGTYELGEQIVFKMLLQADDVYINQVLFYYQNMGVFTDYYNELSTSPFIIDRYTNSCIEGEITNTDGKKYLLLSIPFEEDWKVHIDNVSVPTVKIFDTLLAVEIQNGKHRIVLEYIPKYLHLGIAITAMSIAILIAIFIIRPQRYK